MNASHLEMANISAGPLDGESVPVRPGQHLFHAILGDREHTYLRIADTRNFVHVSIRRLFPASDGLEVAELDRLIDRFIQIRDDIKGFISEDTSKP